MTLRPLPYSQPYDLAALPEQGAIVTLTPAPGERAVIAEWLGVEAIMDLTAEVEITRKGEDSFDCAGRFSADLVQTCVITLEPCPTHVAGEFRRRFRILPKEARGRRPAHPVTINVFAKDEEEPDFLETPVLDLAQPVLEELSLSLDPYPRAPGAVFAPPPEAAPPPSPFAVLEKLRTPGASSPGGQKAKSRQEEKG